MKKFFKLHKFLFENEYKNLSIEAKVLYSVMIDRLDLSYENNLADENGKFYIYMKIEEMQEIFNCGKNKAIRVINELENINLINKTKQGLNRTNKFYVENIDLENKLRRFENETLEGLKNKPRRFENETLEGLKNKPRRFENETLEGLENKLQKVSKSNSIKTEYNKTEYNKTEYNKTEYNKSCALAQDKKSVNFQIPLKDGSYYTLNKDDLDFYKSLYPNVDIQQEIKNIIGWNTANNTKRKTKMGIKKHINTWLSKANIENKGGVNFGKYTEKIESYTNTNNPTAEDYRRFIQGK